MFLMGGGGDTPMQYPNFIILWYIIDFIIKFYSYSKGAYATMTFFNLKHLQITH